MTIMTRELSSIIELKSIRERKSILSERESELSRPILTDLSLISRLRSWFDELADGLPRRDKSTLTKEFIFIVLFLYSPGTLAGGKMRGGVRKALGDALGIIGKSSISDKLDIITFNYRTYKFFRRDLDVIYPAILEKLRQQGHCRE